MGFSTEFSTNTKKSLDIFVKEAYGSRKQKRGGHFVTVVFTDVRLFCALIFAFAIFDNSFQ